MFQCKCSALNPSLNHIPCSHHTKNTHIGVLVKVQEQHFNVLGASSYLKSTLTRYLKVLQKGSRVKPEHVRNLSRTESLP